MGDRGSKSDYTNKSVKEQRVDGSYFENKTRLRYTLTGCVSGYPVKNPSKQLIKLNYSTINSEVNKLNP